jgi:hypothetical protein
MRLQTREDRVHESATKKLKHTVIQKYFFLKFELTLKPAEQIKVPGKYITGAALDRPALEG